MAIVKGQNKTKLDANPTQKLDPGELKGRVRLVHEKYTTVANLALNDEIEGPPLPENALVCDAILKADANPTTGIFSLGHRATVDRAGNALAEDPDAFIDSADSGGQAVFQRMGADPANLEAGFGVRFGQETGVFALVTEATDGGAGEDIEWFIFYTIS